MIDPPANAASNALSDAQASDRTPSLIFSPLTDCIVVITASIVGIGLILFGMFRSVTLIHQIDPTLRSAAIGTGVFIGVLLAGVTTDAWNLGIDTRPPPRGPMALVSLLVLIGACGFGGNMLAGLFVEWRAFHAIAPAVHDEAFTVTDTNVGLRTTDWIELRSDAGDTLSLNCFNDVLGAVRRGDRLLLRVETGRNGVERTSLPYHAADLRKA